MSEFFDFLGMVGDNEQRKVARWPEKGEWVVDTCRVTDNIENPFETAVQHPCYNDGKIVIVEEYKDIEAAEKGHAKWVDRMSADELPERLVDVSSCGMAKLHDYFGGPGFRQSPKM